MFRLKTAIPLKRNYTQRPKQLKRNCAKTFVVIRDFSFRLSKVHANITNGKSYFIYIQLVEFLLTGPCCHKNITY